MRPRQGRPAAAAGRMPYSVHVSHAITHYIPKFAVLALWDLMHFIPFKPDHDNDDGYISWGVEKKQSQASMMKAKIGQRTTRLGPSPGCAHKVTN